MNMWLAIFLIVAFVMVADTIQKVARAKAQSRTNDEEVREATARINELEERIAVLERIVTEEKHDLRHQISQL